MLRRNLAANYIGQGWAAAMALAFVPVYIQQLGIEAWALVGLMVMLQAWLVLIDMGLTPALVREMAIFKGGGGIADEIHDFLRSLEYIYVIISLVVIAVVWQVAPWISVSWLNAVNMPDETVAGAIRIMGFVLAIRMVEQVYRGAIIGLQSQVWLNVVQSLIATLRWAGAAILVIWLDKSIYTFFIWQCMVSMLSVLFLMRKARYLLPKPVRRARFNIQIIKRVAFYAGGTLVLTMLSLLLIQIDKLLLSRILSLDEYGYYTFASILASGIGYLISPVTMAAQPQFTTLVAKKSFYSLKNIYFRLSYFMSSIIIPVALVMSIFAEEVIYVWTGDVGLSHNSSHLLAILCVGMMFNGLIRIPYSIQLAHGRTNILIAINTAAVFFSATAIINFVPYYGSVGAAIVWCITNAAILAIGVHFLHIGHSVKEKWLWFRDTVLWNLIISLTFILCIKYMINNSDERIILFFSLALTALGCIALLFVNYKLKLKKIYINIA